MKYFFVLLGIVWISGSVQAQDTIFKKSKARVLAKVIAVGPDTVTYHKASMPDGPVYSLAKSEIIWIRYEGGGSDSFVVAPKVTSIPSGPSSAPGTFAPGAPPLEQKSAPKESSLRIDQSRGGRYFYVDNRRWNQKRVSKLLETSRDPQVYEFLHKSWSQKALGTVCSIGSIPLTVVGGFAMLGGLIVQSSAGQPPNYSPDNSGSFYTTGLVCIATGAAANVIGTIYKKKARASYLRAIELYNAGLL